MSRVQRRLIFFGPVGAGLAAVLAWGLTGLPSFGQPHSDYARYLIEHATAQRHTTNIVTAIVFDYRGWDTLGEELIMVAGVLGTALLLRSSRGDDHRVARDMVASDLLHWLSPVTVAVVLLLALWTVSYGYLTPGGGFQGGVVGSAAALLTWVAESHQRYRALTPAPLVDAAEGGGAFLFLAVGLAGLATGGTYLDNIMPLGDTGTLASGGTIAVLNWATGRERSRTRRRPNSWLCTANSRRHGHRHGHRHSHRHSHRHRSRGTTGRLHRPGPAAAGPRVERCCSRVWDCGGVVSAAKPHAPSWWPRVGSRRFMTGPSATTQCGSPRVPRRSPSPGQFCCADRTGADRHGFSSWVRRRAPRRTAKRGMSASPTGARCVTGTVRAPSRMEASRHPLE